MGDDGEGWYYGRCVLVVVVRRESALVALAQQMRNPPANEKRGRPLRGLQLRALESVKPVLPLLHVSHLTPPSATVLYTLHTHPSFSVQRCFIIDFAAPRVQRSSLSFQSRAQKGKGGATKKLTGRVRLVCSANTL